MLARAAAARCTSWRAAWSTPRWWTNRISTAMATAMSVRPTTSGMMSLARIDRSTPGTLP